LILGIYRRLVGALSRVDKHLLASLRQGKWQAAAAYIDLRFLLGILIGVAIGIFTTIGMVNTLLQDEQTRPLTLAAFFGMILASSVMVARLIRVNVPTQLLGAAALGIAGAAFAYWLTGLSRMQAEPELWYVFLCGAVAICAMILPGISGAYVLLILGMYIYLSDIIKALPRLQVTGDELAAVAVFCTGCLMGLLSFSKLLKWLLVRFEALTMGLLCGFMIGALRKIWPWQRDLSPEVEEFRRKEFEEVWPEAIDGQFWLIVAIAGISAGVVFGIDYWTRTRTARASQ